MAKHTLEEDMRNVLSRSGRQVYLGDLERRRPTYVYNAFVVCGKIYNIYLTYGFIRCLRGVTVPKFKQTLCLHFGTAILVKYELLTEYFTLLWFVLRVNKCKRSFRFKQSSKDAKFGNVYI